MNVLAGQADVINSELVSVRNMLIVSPRANLATFLSSIELFSEPQLCLAFNLKRSRLRATSGYKVARQKQA